MSLKNLDRFKINNEIGKKLCYTLYEAEDQDTGQTVFLKVLDETRAKEKHSGFNFLNGARIASLLDNPSICKVIHFGGDSGRYFIAAEAITHEPLRSIIQPEFALSFEDLIEMFVRVGKALRSAHLQGAIHGLLNPDSIFISSDGDIKIHDFGFNWYVPQILQRTDKEAVQLAHYISPEFYKPQTYDGRVDIYSLGIILYHLVNGALPFPAGKTGSMAAVQRHHLNGDWPAINFVEKGLPQEMEAILHRALAVKENVRFLNFKEFLDSLELLRRGNLQMTPAALEPQEAEELIQQKYFDDKAYEIDFGAKNARAFPISRKRLAQSGAAVFIFLILFLLITNRLPLPFGGEEDESGIAEELLSSTGGAIQSDSLFAQASTPDSVSAAGDSLPADDSLIAATVGPVITPPISESEADADAEGSVPASKTESKSTDGEVIAAVVSNDKPTSEPPKSTAAAPPAPKPNETPTTSPVSGAVAENGKTPDRPAATLQAAKVTVMVHSQNQPVEAFVFIDNQFRGKTNAQGFFEVPGLEVNKTYTIKISKEGHASLTRQFTALEKTPVLNFDISARQEIYGTLILEALPKADSIFVDGKLYKGQTPLQLNLPWGDHRVRFVNTSLNKSHEQTVSLKVGEVQRLKHNFAQAEFGKVAVSLKNAAQYGFGYVYVNGKLWEGAPNTTPLELSLPVGTHTIEVRRDGFNAVPKDIIVTVEKDQTKFVSFTILKN